MRQQRFIISGIALAAIFSFDMVKAMKSSEGGSVKTQLVKNIPTTTEDQNDVPKKKESTTILEANFPTEIAKLKELNLFGNGPDNQKLGFNDPSHLIDICNSQYNLENLGLSLKQKTGKTVKPVVDWGPPAVAAGWCIRNLIQKKGIGHYIPAVTIGAVSGMYHFFKGKNKYNETIKTWDDNYKKDLLKKQSALTSLLNDVSRENTDNEQPSIHSAFQFLSIMKALENRIVNNKNFESYQDYLRRIYSTKYKDTITYLAQTKSNDAFIKLNDIYMPGARKFIDMIIKHKEQKKEEVEDNGPKGKTKTKEKKEEEKTK